MKLTRNDSKKQIYTLTALLTLLLGSGLVYWPVSGFELWTNQQFWISGGFDPASLSTMFVKNMATRLGLNPGSLHLICLFLHILITVALYCLIINCGASWAVALVCAGFFVLHPAGSGAVANLSSIPIITAGLVCLIWLNLLIIRAPDCRNKKIVWIFVGTAMACLVSPVGLSLPIAGLAALPSKKQSKSSGYAVMTVAILTGGVILALVPPGWSTLSSWLTRYAGIWFNALAHIGTGIVWPFGTGALFAGQTGYLAGPFLYALAWVIMIGTWPLIAHISPLLMMGIGLIGSGLLIPAGSEMDGFVWLGEQVYLALAGLVLVLAWAVNRLNRQTLKRLWVAGLALLICIFGVLVRQELDHWQTWERFLARQSIYFPVDYRFKLWRGRELINMNRLNEAEKELRAVLSMNPEEAQPHMYMGAIRLVQRRFQEAINHFRLALERDPNLGEAHNGWAGTLLQMGLPIEAVVHYQKAVAIKPDPSWYNNLGQVLDKLGRIQEALHAYEQAAAGSNGHPVPLNNLAVVLYRMGRYQEAKTKLEAALAKQPDFVEARENLANVNHSLKNRD